MVPARLPVNYQAPWTLTHAAPIDASSTEQDLKVTFRPAEDSIRDTVRWLLDADRA